jgi:HPr kinase/phosphorylase
VSEIADQDAKSVSIDDLVGAHKSRLMLDFIAGHGGGWRSIYSAETNRPSLALTGFVDLYAFDRAQVLGNTELLYLASLDAGARREALEIIYQFELPCVIITNSFVAFPEMIEIAERMEIPLLLTPLSTARFLHQFVACIDDHFAQTTVLHGSLVDVYGVGLLMTGASGIGKSEIALDLVERGHRLVADDVVHVRRQQNILVGTSNPLLRHNMEIRGIGIIDVERMYGVRAVREAKRIEVEVRLEEWDKQGDYERTGITGDESTHLGIAVPKVRLPIYPGKNITVISETIAMAHMLKVRGVNPAEELDTRLSTTLGSHSAADIGDPDAT